MKSKKPDKKQVLKSVKIEEDIVNLVKENKKKTYVPIGEFFKLAAMEKLSKQQIAQ